MEIDAYDTFFSTNTARAVVNIFVTRNGDDISFVNPSQYFVTVNEYRQLADEIFTVAAVDPDGVSLFLW
jgi:hypothetical protein